MLKKIMLTLILTVFMSCSLMSNVMATAPNPYPDTSMYPESKLNVADLYDITKYKAIGATRVNQLIISYHIAVGDSYPKYVSLLWDGEIVVGFTYYDSGVFYIWMKLSKIDPVFIKVDPMNKRIQKAFKHDFEIVWNIEFPLAIIS